MVQVSRADDHLKSLSKRAWQPDPDHPDVDALNEATKLASLFERALVLEDVISRPADFRGWMEDSRVQSAALRDALAELKKGTGSSEAADGAYKTLAKTCSACHEVYRN